MSRLSTILSRQMSNQGLTIEQAAQAMAKSTKTLRRYIADGKVKAQLIKGQYRIFEIPGEVTKEKPRRQTGQSRQTGQQQTINAERLIWDLQQQNLQLAAQLGIAQERNRALENQVKLLTTPKLPLWKRILKKTAFKKSPWAVQA